MVRRRARAGGAPALAVALLGVTAASCGATPPCGLRLCDARDPECQRAISASAACLREVPPVRVPVSVVARDEYLRQQTQEPLSARDEQVFYTLNGVRALWGLAPPGLTPADASSARASAVAAFYSPADKAIVVIDDGSPLDDPWTMTVLVHEMTHALQDARVDITQLFNQHGQDFDRSLAISAVVEGEATYVQDLGAVGLFGDLASDVPWDQVYQSWRERARKTALASSLPVTLAPFHFNYPFGTKVVHDGAVAGGWAGVDALLATPPSGTRELLAGLGAPEPAAGPWAEDLINDAVPVLPERFTLQSADRMGAWIAGLFFERAGLPFAGAAAEGLRGDVLSTYRDTVSGGVVGFWRFRFSSVDLAATVAAGAVVWDNGRARQVDRDVTLTIAGDPGSLLEIPEDLAFQPVPPAPAAAPADGSAPSRGIGCAPPAVW
jgi:hypothetical protein